MRGNGKLRWETYEDKAQKRLQTTRAYYRVVIKNVRYGGIFFMLCLIDSVNIIKVKVVSVPGISQKSNGG